MYTDLVRSVTTSRSISDDAAIAEVSGRIVKTQIY